MHDVRANFFNVIDERFPSCSTVFCSVQLSFLFSGDLMNLPSVRLLVVAGSLGLLTVATACGSKGQPAAPTPSPTTPTVTATLSPPSPKTPTGGQTIEETKPTLTVTNSTATGSVGT